jgi:HK97 family phage portal protein
MVRNPFRRRLLETEARDITSVPWDRGGPLSHAAVTQERALGLAPVFAATRILAGTVSTLPIKGYRKVGDQRVPMASLPQLFEQLTLDGELVPWLHQCMTSLVLRGNAYGLVTARDGFMFPTRVEWLNPSDVHCDDTQSVINPIWYWKGRQIDNPENLLHIPWFKVPGMAQGLSPIGAFAATLNTGLYAQAYGNDWFEAGGFPPGIMRNTVQPVVEEAKANEISSRLTTKIRDRRPVVTGSDWEYKTITVPPNEAQFVETMRLSATQIANIYGLPPEKVGGTTGQPLTYATVELNQIEVALAVRPWLVVLESAFAAQLPERQYVKFNADAIVRADLKSRYEAYQLALTNGWANVDEVRAYEELSPLPDGLGKEYNTPAAKAARAPQVEPMSDNGTAPLNGARQWQIPA